MSVTSQLKDKNSPLRQFFLEYENKAGMNECLAALQASKPTKPLGYKPASNAVYAFIGTATDYLIRYNAGGNKLIFEDTIACSALKSIISYNKPLPDIIYDYEIPFLQPGEYYMNSLSEIGMQYIDGRPASDFKAIYSATALAVMDGVYRSTFLPKLFYKSIPSNEIERIGKMKDDELEIETKKYLDQIGKSLFEKYYNESLGGELYAQDISELLNIFQEAVKYPENELFNAQFVVFNQSLNNEKLVGGVDFDCVIKHNNRMILTDIKTTIKPLKHEHLYQIISYALLQDEKWDNFKFTDIGIYHSRSGSFRFIPIEKIIDNTLHGFNSVNQARDIFLRFLS